MQRELRTDMAVHEPGILPKHLWRGLHTCLLRALRAPMPAWRPRLLRPFRLAAATSGEGVSGTVIWLAGTSLR